MKYWVLILITIFFTACNSSSVSCKMKPLKHKKYRVNKTKTRYSAVNSKRSNSSKNKTTNHKERPLAKTIPSDKAVIALDTLSVSEPILSEVPIETNLPKFEKDKEFVKELPQENNKEIPNEEEAPIVEEIDQNKEETLAKNEAEELTSISKNGVSYNPFTHVDLNGQLFEKDEKITYQEEIEFIANYAILKYREDFDTKLKDLIDFLNEYPEKKVIIFGNGGYENYNRFDDFSDDGKFVKFGSGHKVYNQYFRNLANTNAFDLKRIEEEGFPVIENRNGELVQRKRSKDEVRFEYDYYNNKYLPAEGRVGDILQARANKIKDYLIEQGISPERIYAKKGKFIAKEYHDVIIYVE